MAKKPWKPEIKSDADGNLIVPRLTVGHGIIGPEYYGCCGTGQRPVIRRISDGRYIVGKQSGVDSLRCSIGAMPNKRIFRSGGETVFAFKSRKPAVAKFHELCAVVTNFNDEQRAAHRADSKAAATGDIAAALRLGSDY